MLEKSLATLTQIAEDLKIRGDDREARLRLMESAAKLNEHPEPSGLITPERIIWALVCIIAYLLKVPGFINP